MAEFDDRRRDLDAARTAREQAAGAAFLAGERVKRVEAQRAAFDRKFDPRNQQHIAERERLAKELDRARVHSATMGREHERTVALETGAIGQFAVFSDPRDAIARLDDGIPILLFPVRLETRFQPGDDGPELWVRIYPDDCSIDTFDAALSEAEVANAKLYWITMWEAGGIEADERGAWRGLVAGHGSGRAEWIIAQYVPLNIAVKPLKPLATDIILTIPTEVALAPAEERAAAAYWREIWLADGDAARAAAARTALENATSLDRAKIIIDSYVPANLAAKPQPPLTRQQVTVTVAFVVFPDSATLDLKRHSWARAPFARALPDRFVFIGYAGEAPPLVVVGNPVPSALIVGPDPSAPEAEQMKHTADGDLVFPDEMSWMVNFPRAVEQGMGFRIPLDALHARGFDRILVVGLRASADENTGKLELERLFDHHRYGRSGFELVAQGTPTNNTESAQSGYSRGSDPDATFDDRSRFPLFADEYDWLDKRDGQWLAEALGIDAAPLRTVHNSDGRDQADARAMNVALWPATLGYWMETMMSPVFDRETVEQTREFFNRYVIGRGAVPAIRIGRQPYGILPATAVSRMRWFLADPQVVERSRPPVPFLRDLNALLQGIDNEWRRLAGEVSYVGKSGDAHQILLSIIGLHSGSVEFAQRYAESVEQLSNRLSLEGLGWISGLAIAGLQQMGRELLRTFGYNGDSPDLLSKFFFKKHNPLLGPLIDDKPLSESEAIRAYTADNRNYLQWLIDAGRTSIDAVYAQQGFLDNRPPRALLYLFLRHSLQLGYHDVSVRLHESAGLFNRDAAVRAKRDEPFVHISDRTKTSESRYQLLYKSEPAITGSPNVTIADYISSSLVVLQPARYLREQIEALERLKNASTSRLERAFAEHIDCASYRVDAWLLGLVNYQLTMMRNVRDRTTAPARKGIYLGAYAWLEDIRPETRQWRNVQLKDPQLVETFQRRGDPPLRADSANEGYIHAPSLNHAVAAAVLRNGYISDASPANRETMAVNLTSERVRIALAILEGIRGGQKLGALLGYQFERGLHDNHALAEVDKFIYDLRKAFPLAAQLSSTRDTDPPDASIEAIEARNVIDGLALVNQMKSAATYPFGKTLPPATPAEAAAINREAERLRETHDAVSDLALAEGVYQAVLGNYDRVASTYDAYSKGNFPPEPQVVQTPVSGIGLTHRAALHLESGLDPTASPIAGMAMTPRAQAEPAINQWLSKVLPPLSDVGCKVSFRDSATNAIVDRQVTLRNLAVQPADVLRLVGDDLTQQLTELDDRIVRFIVTTESPRPDTRIAIEYMKTTTAPLSVFQLMPLVRQLRRLTQTSRPLQPTDLTLSNEAKRGADAMVSLPRQRVADIRAALQTLRNDLANFVAPIEPLVADVGANHNALLANADGYATDISALLERAAAFAVPQTGSGFAHDFRQRTFRSILDKAAKLVVDWNARLAGFAPLIVEYDALPMGVPDMEKFTLLARAERFVSTTSTMPRPMMPDDLRDELVNVKEPAFRAKRDSFAALASTNRIAVAQLIADAKALLPIDLFEERDLSFDDEEDAADRFAEDVARVVKVVLADIDRRLAASSDALTTHDGAAAAADRVAALTAGAKALVGTEVVLVPEFSLTAAQGDEVEQALALTTSGDLLKYLTDIVHTDFPVDTWLYGVARVRDKMKSWEDVVMLSGAFGRAEPELTPLQIPFIANDRWLALEFPPDAKLDTDRLLYTAHFSTPFQKAAAQCGLLLDEWSEVIPAADATTGVAFHYDRPNSEAPQTMLLVTPAEFVGAWRWNDLVDALNETLDLAKRRAVEPVHFESSPYARFLPATIMAVTMRQLSISANLAYNNRLILAGESS